MADTQDLVRRAAELGEAIANHPDVQAFMTARAAVEKDAEAQALLKAYAEHANRLRQFEAEQKPIEVEDKHKLAQYEQQMASNDALKSMMATQVNYVALMNQVNSAMEGPISAAHKSDA